MANEMTQGAWNWATNGDEWFVESSANNLTIATLGKRATKGDLFAITAVPDLIAAVEAARALLADPDAEGMDADRVSALLDAAYAKAMGRAS